MSGPDNKRAELKEAEERLKATLQLPTSSNANFDNVKRGAVKSDPRTTISTDTSIDSMVFTSIVKDKPESSSRFTWSATKKDERKIFIGGLPRDVTMDEFCEFFGQFGEILDAIVMFDKQTKRSRGFGFVTYSDPAVSKKMASYGDHEDGIGRIEMRGKICEIKAAEPKAGAAVKSKTIESKGTDPPAPKKGTSSPSTKQPARKNTTFRGNSSHEVHFNSFPRVPAMVAPVQYGTPSPYPTGMMVSPYMQYLPYYEQPQFYNHAHYYHPQEMAAVAMPTMHAYFNNGVTAQQV